ncbi:MAG: hypothetical protein IKU90_04425 [Clostridia bacterium]|nr:hypothetical protein [Clostridia bacterium]
MKYQFFEFHLLQSVFCKGRESLGRVYENFTSYMGIPVTMPCFLHALRGLTAGGYITLDSPDGILNPDVSVSITDAGRKAVKPSFLQGLLGEFKATVKKELAFCALDRPANAEEIDIRANAEDFTPLVRPLIDSRDIAFPTFELNDLGDGIVKLTVHHPNDDIKGEYDKEDVDPDGADQAYSASVTGYAEQIMAGMRDLISAAHAMVSEAPKTRKVALHGADGSLLITLARAVNENGMTTFRMTVSKIRFNRQRFYGKRDGELDYAQCGDPIFVTELSDEQGFAYFAVLHSTVTFLDLLSDGDMDKLSEIYRATRPYYMT